MHRSEPLLDSCILSKSILHFGEGVKSPYAKKLGELAFEASAAEVMTAPKPGLVDPLGPGCHTDMDCEMFIRSSEAISPYWGKQALTGICGTPPCAAMKELRTVGLEMEEAMFKATGGINTHKGLIYLMSLMLYGAGYCKYKGTPPTQCQVAGYAAAAAAGTVQRELAALGEGSGSRELTNGERLYMEHGVTGIRGEAEGGFPSILNFGLPELIRTAALGVSNNNSYISALLALMGSCQDSNVIHRGGYAFWKGAYLDMVKRAQADFDPRSNDYSAIKRLESEFIPLRISPGGAADLLSCTIFIRNLTSPPCQQ